jgi:hypothetical protein
LIDRDFNGLSTIEQCIEDELFVFLKLFILYADDTVIMSEKATDLQYA